MKVQSLVALRDHVTVIRDGREKKVIECGRVYYGWLHGSGTWIVRHDDRIHRRHASDLFATVDGYRAMRLEDIGI